MRNSWRSSASRTRRTGMRWRWICRLTNNSVEDLRDLNAASLRERDARVIANIARLRFSPLSLIGGSGNRLIEEGGRQLLDLSASFGADAGVSLRRLTSRNSLTLKNFSQ